MAIINIKTYKPKPEDVFILDSNIWVYLFDKSSVPDQYIENSIDVYTDFYKKVLLCNAKILLTSFNVREIVQTLIKNDFNTYKAMFKDISDTSFKKSYRPSEYYKNLLVQIKIVISKILKVSEKIQDGFNTFPYEKFLNQDIDFPDEYIAYIASEQNCFLITHDNDFKNCAFNVDILTANRHLLR